MPLLMISMLFNTWIVHLLRTYTNTCDLFQSLPTPGPGVNIVSMKGLILLLGFCCGIVAGFYDLPTDSQLESLAHRAPFVSLLYNPPSDEDEGYLTDCDRHIIEYIGRLVNFPNAYSPGEQLGWAFKSNHFFAIGKFGFPITFSFFFSDGC